jgi:hypothetical protein
MLLFAIGWENPKTTTSTAITSGGITNTQAPTHIQMLPRLRLVGPVRVIVNHQLQRVEPSWIPSHINAARLALVAGKPHQFPDLLETRARRTVACGAHPPSKSKITHSIPGTSQ